MIFRYDSSVDIATDYRLEDRGSIPCRDLIFSLLHSVQTGSGANTAPIQWLPGALPKGIKRPERGADHSPRPNAEVPHTSSWRGALLIKQRDVSFKPVIHKTTERRLPSSMLHFGVQPLLSLLVTDLFCCNV
jgi:hypothetical protein